MCGIALILSEVTSAYSAERVGSADLGTEQVHGMVLLADDLKVALGRRGPDSIGSKKAFLQLRRGIKNEEDTDSFTSQKSSECIVSSNGLLEMLRPSRPQIGDSSLQSSTTQSDAMNGVDKERELFYHADKEREFTHSMTKIVCAHDILNQGGRSFIELHFLGATLQLRGICPVSQPLADDSGNILVYNGEIFGGIHVDRDENDGEVLLHTLGKCPFCHEPNISTSVPDILSSIKGPWALIYWQARSKTIWFGRDVFGRRSLLVHWPTKDDPEFVLTSVQPVSPKEVSGPSDVGASFYWDELPCGIYSMCLEATEGKSYGSVHRHIGGVEKHKWMSPLQEELVKWERKHVDPRHKFCSYGVVDEECALHFQHELIPHVSESCEVFDMERIKSHAGDIRPTYKLFVALRESVARRTVLNSLFQTLPEKSAPVAVLFSGGLDSMILAALLDQCLNPEYSIDLLNVSFDGMDAPDRISGRLGVKELQRISPTRRWQFVEIDADLSNLDSETKHVASLIYPARTYMDLNIGISLWLAASGEGFIRDENCIPPYSHPYKSMARVLLVGSGADEQCAGYGRHRTKYRLGGWISLHKEMRLDMQRIWIRNMGRDDRCISDHGKEARFPFLDEDVVKTLLDIPLWEIARLDEPVGRGDKKILREVARLLGLEAASFLPKRAIQFGSRIARESNKMHFGSNRAANQASAGAVLFDG